MEKMEHKWISGPTRLDLMNIVHASHPGGKGSGRGEEETVSTGGRGVMHRSGRLFWSAGSLSEGGMSSWSESGRVMKASKGMVADELGSTKGSHARVVLWCSVLGFGAKIRGEAEWTHLCGSVWVPPRWTGREEGGYVHSRGRVVVVLD